MLKGFLKAHRPPKVSNEIKCTNEKMTRNTQDMNLSWNVPKANVDHTISAQGTGISILRPLDHHTKGCKSKVFSIKGVFLFITSIWALSFL